MKTSILYAGDDDLTRAAAYLGGVMTHAALGFDHLASDHPFADEMLEGISLLILSDYPAKRFASGQISAVAEAVRAGMGLLMVGGWDSFRGQGGLYDSTPLAEVLCVDMSAEDDRVNYSQPCVVVKAASHAIVDSLPLDSPPCIGGYNRVRAKADATVVLEVRRFDVKRNGDECVFSPYSQPDPLLVVGAFGRGRVTAFASDVAPHWVGPLVDWGRPSITACAPGGNEVEVGCSYAALMEQMVRWTAGL